MFLKPLRVLFELLGSLLGASWEPLGASWGDLGPSWGEIVWSWATFGALDFFTIFWLARKACKILIFVAPASVL